MKRRVAGGPREPSLPLAGARGPDEVREFPGGATAGVVPSAGERRAPLLAARTLAHGKRASPGRGALTKLVSGVQERSKALLASWWGQRETWAPWIGVLSAAVAYAVLLAYIANLRQDLYFTNAYDLGNYDQALWTTVFHHQIFFNTSSLGRGSSGWVVLGHFSPFLVLLLPFFALWPGPGTLLSLQAAALAAGALPTYGLARERLGTTRWGLAMAVLYLATPLTFWTAWFDIHTEAFFVAPVLAMFYFLEKRKVGPTLFFLGLALSTIETLAGFVILWAALSLLGLLWDQRRGHDRGTDRGKARLVMLVLVLSLSWLLLSLVVIDLQSTVGGSFGGSYARFWVGLGANTPYQVVPDAILHPSAAWAALSADGSSKVLYVLLILGAVSFLPLVGEMRFTIPGGFWLALAALSSASPAYRLGDQYTAYVLPFFIASSVTSVQRILRWAGSSSGPKANLHVGAGPSRLRRSRIARLTPWALVGTLAVSLGMVTAVANPLTVAPLDAYTPVGVGWPTPVPHDAWLDRLVSLVPPGASILTTPRIFPHVSGRENAFVVPLQTPLLPAMTFGSLLQSLLNRSNFVLLDYQDDYLASALAQQDGNLSGFSLLGVADGAYLYERGYPGPIELWHPLEIDVAGGELTPGNAVADPTNATPIGPSLYHSAGLQNGTRLWTGPTLLGLGPGTYVARSWLTLSTVHLGPQVQISLNYAPVVIVPELIYNSSLIQKFDYVLVPQSGGQGTLANDTVSVEVSGDWNLTGNVTEEFTWGSLGYLSTYGWGLAPGMSVRLYAVDILQVSP